MMSLDGNEGYFTIERKGGEILLIANGLNGGAFLLKNWEGLERITFEGVEFQRILGIPGGSCRYLRINQQQTYDQSASKSS